MTMSEVALHWHRTSQLIEQQQAESDAG